MGIQDPVDTWLFIGAPSQPRIVETLHPSPSKPAKMSITQGKHEPKQAVTRAGEQAALRPAFGFQRWCQTLVLNPGEFLHLACPHATLS